MEKTPTSLTTKLLVGFALICAALASAAALLLVQASAAAPGTPLPRWLLLLALVTVCLFAAAVVHVRRVLQPVRRLRETVQKLTDGDYEVRAALSSGDELETIGRGLDHLLAQRSNLLGIENESEQLNDSIIALLKTVAAMAQKDLTGKAKVRSDVTGPIADALNLMTVETATVLRSVTRVAANVAETSNLIKTQADHIVLLARKERQDLEECARELAISAEATTHIARMAQSSTEAADRAAHGTRTAIASMEGTLGGFRSIREAIRETEVRIKSLTQRAQEIAGAVNLVTHISERTHILALNASMHAAAVGEAGRGFSAVADEVQRLAENAREMTMQIGAIISSVQSETQETMRAIEVLALHVQAGSQLADRSGQDMKLTEATTASLVELVQKIAAAAATQMKISKTVKERTSAILDNVSRTGAYLLGQAEHTDHLLEQAMALVESVGVFKLPDEAQDRPPGT
ncbi:MAG: methyl-accepting chemotaxis protein [Chromatiales bacterium]